MGLNLINAETGEEAPATKEAEAHSLASMVIAGFFGGPIALGYLGYRNFVALGIHERSKQAIAMFAIALSF